MGCGFPAAGRRIYGPVILLLATGLWLAAAEPVRLHFHRTAEVDGPVLILSRLAGVEGAAGDWRLWLENLDLGRAPLPGALRVMTRQMIMRAIQSQMSQKKDFPPPPVITASGADVITIRRPGCPPDPAALQTGLHDWLAREWGLQPEQITAVKLAELARAMLPPGEQSFRFRPAGRAGEAICRAGCGGYEKEFTVRFRPVLKLNVAVAARELPYRHAPVAGDVRFEEREVHEPPEVFIRWPEQLTGMVTGVRLAAGDVLRQDRMRRDYIIKRGAAVKITYSGPGLSVSAVGRAMQPGRSGQSIQVKNESSGRTLSARVIAPGIVQVQDGRQ